MELLQFSPVQSIRCSIIKCKSLFMLLDELKFVFLIEENMDFDEGKFSILGFEIRLRFWKKRL